MRTLVGLAVTAVLSACGHGPEPSVPADMAGSALGETMFNIPAGTRVNIFTGASAGAQAAAQERDWPTFRICSPVEAADEITLAIGALDRVGPEHPDIRRLSVTPGSCHYVSGPVIEAVGAPHEFSTLVLSKTGPGDANERREAEKVANSWLTARIATLEADPPSAERDALLEDFRLRASGVGNGSPSVELVVALVSAKPVE